MSTVREAAQKALDAIYRWHLTDGETHDLMPAFEALRDALEKPEPDIKAAVKKERECCAQLCEVLGHALDATWRSCADAIRARGDEK